MPLTPSGLAAAAVAALVALLPCAPAAIGTWRADATVAPARWGWPLDPRPRVVRAFEAPSGPFAAGHRGVDLAARVGAQVRSAGAGVIGFAGRVAGRGVVTVDHPGGWRTTYEPVAAAVGAGRRVATGALLGTVSAAPGHCLPGTCLHWGLRLGASYRDPLRLVGAAGVRLLPVWTAVTTARAAPPRAGGSRRARCRPARRVGRTRDPPRW